MGAIFNLLEKHRLQSYFNKFLQFGVKDERDFLDGVTNEDLDKMGFSQVEKNRFATMKDVIRRLRAPARPTGAPVLKSLEPFCLQYTYPKCPEPKYIRDMDPAQNTVEDLMLRICHLESVGSSKGVCLYTVDGMPLTDDPFFNTWSLKDRHVENGDVLYAIFTANENLTTAVTMPKRDVSETTGEDNIRCHIMLRGDFELTVNLESDTITNLKHKLAKETGIPASVLHYKGEHGTGNTLQSCGISEGSTAYFSLSSFSDETPDTRQFFIDDVVPSVQQTKKGISFFLSSLYIIHNKRVGAAYRKLIGYIRRVTGCNPLAQSLHQLLMRNEYVSKNQKIAIVEGLYMLFRELLPKLGTKQGEKVIEDIDVFENSTFCWAYLITEAMKEKSDFENYAPLALTSEEGSRFCDPVKVPGIPGSLERAFVLQTIEDGGKLPNCTEEVLQVTSVKRATEVEKMLLSVHPSIRTYQLWISHESVTGQNFQINTETTFQSMAEELKSFPYLNVTPPLLLKDLGFDDECLVFLSEDNLGIYVCKNKAFPATIQVYDCLAGKDQNVDVNQLAARTGDHRDDHTFATTRTPKEAILVLIDTSSSMNENCYGSVEIKKIHVVKELFDNFATRSMAYDFHHVIGLVKFDSTVNTLHTFTETLEVFKEHVRSLEAGGRTLLYDALQHGILELEKVKKKFPECRLRILCLTDGNDVGSSNKPVNVAANLIKSSIIMDSILLGKVENHMLQGISNATGGCCFKPETSKDGLKLFEIETVLSLELRKPKNKLDPSSISENNLREIFASHGYDEFPEASLPSQMTNKVTMTESALKKKIPESKDGHFMEKDKRILEELRSLHCEPHPFFNIFPSESDFMRFIRYKLFGSVQLRRELLYQCTNANLTTPHYLGAFWKILMEGPAGTPYEKGVFELYCQFGPDYPVKPPLVRFVTRIYHCNINSVGRICHNIFDRAYNAHITMRDILDAVYGLLIIPEPEDPLDSILAEEFLTSRDKYDQEAKKHTEETAGTSLDVMEKKLELPVPKYIPPHLLCPLTKKMFVDPVKTRCGAVYERKAIEKHLRIFRHDPSLPPAPKNILRRTDLKADHEMKTMVTSYRSGQIQDTSV